MIQILKKAIDSIIGNKTLTDIEKKATEKYESLLAAEVKKEAVPADNKPAEDKPTTVETV
jgi:hypothetical protein